MARPIGRLMSRQEALRRVEESLGFPWPPSRVRALPLEEAQGRLLGTTLAAREDHPPFARSLRDGFALRAEDTAGASPTSPAFLRLAGEIPMGQRAPHPLDPGEAFLIHTGGMVPPGADGVLMLEDATVTAGWVEVRRSLQRGDHVVFRGEEFAAGDPLLTAGTRLDEGHLVALAAQGYARVPCGEPLATVLSTGDEIVSVETDPVPEGCVRDANGWFLSAFLRRRGFAVRYGGILGDRRGDLEEGLEGALKESDLVLLSGGSSVSVRDHCEEILGNLRDPGLLVRGVNMQPGKPVLVAGTRSPRRLVLGLPGHPLSCATAAYTVLLPLLGAWFGAAESWICRSQRTLLAEDTPARAGVEEFLPARWTPDGAIPLHAASGYVAALRRADGFLRIPEEQETLRRGEEAEFWWIPR